MIWIAVDFSTSHVSKFNKERVDFKHMDKGLGQVIVKAVLDFFPEDK